MFVHFLEGAMASVTVDYRQARSFYDTAPRKAVGVIVERPSDGSIYIFEEMLSKPELGKIKGMKSCVLETAERHESIEDTRHRAMHEEAPGVDYIFKWEQGYYQVVDGIWACVFVVEAISDRLPVLHQKADIAHPQWISPEYVIDRLWIRRGVKEMLLDYMQARDKVCCMECEEPSLVHP